MVTGAYRDLFVAIAGAAGALTGLLFVALSVAPRPRMAQHPNVIRQVRAAAALVAFTNALAVSLFGLVPHNVIGYPAAVAGVVGLLFALGGLRSILADPVARPRARSQIGLILLLLAAFGVEIVAGIIVAVNPHETVSIDVIGNVLVASLLIGVARSWELVGDRDTGISASIAALAGHERHLGGSVAGPADVPRDDDAVPSGEVAPAGEVVSPGEAIPAGEAVLPGEAIPAGEAVLPGEAIPAGEAVACQVKPSRRGKPSARRNRPAGGGSFARGRSLAGGGGLAERRGWPRRPGGRCRAVLPPELSILPQAGTRSGFRVSVIGR